MKARHSSPGPPQDRSESGDELLVPDKKHDDPIVFKDPS